MSGRGEESSAQFCIGRIEPKVAWLDVFGVIGGLVGAIAGVCVTIMGNLESFNIPDTPHARISSVVFSQSPKALRSSKAADSALEDDRKAAVELVNFGGKQGGAAEI